MADREEARHAIDGGSEVVTVAFVGRAGVNRRAHSQSIDGRELFGRKCALSVEHRGDGIFGAGKGGAERVTDSLEDVTAMLSDGRAHHLVVTADGGLHRGSVPFPSLGAAFDVREGKSDRAGGKRPLARLMGHRAHRRPIRHRPRLPAPGLGCRPPTGDQKQIRDAQKTLSP